MKSDLQLQQDVHDELRWDPRVKAAAIGVAVNERIVTLTGHVPQFAERTAAVHAAQRVAGVRAVVDNLEVQLASPGEREDREIVRAAVNVLAWNSLVPADRIRVSVHHGWLTLEGEVEWQYQRAAAEHAVHATTAADMVKADIEATSQRRARLQGIVSRGKR